MTNPDPFKKVKTTTRRLRARLDDLQNTLNEVIESAAGLQGLQEECEFVVSARGYPGLNFVTLRNALTSRLGIDDQGWVPEFLATTGSGPWEASEFDQFLVNYGFELYELSGNGVTGVIVGAQDWDDGGLAEQIYDRTPDDLRIYTQELFVLGLVMGRDPYDFLEQDVIEEVADLHPAIQFVLNQKFLWPWPTERKDPGGEWSEFPGDVDWAQESVLRLLGYSASASGPDTAGRRAILRKAFEEDLPAGHLTSEQKERWGPRKSARRLYAISHFLSWLIGFQGPDRPAAREKWTSDLSWLKSTFYSKAMRFDWPIYSAPSQELTHERAQWPFEDSRTKTSNAKSDQQRSRLQESGSQRWIPSNALGRLIGGRSTTVEDAVAELNRYIAERRLDFDGIQIRCDQPLFALSGRASLSRPELRELVLKNLTSGKT